LETCGIDKVWQNFFNKYGKADETERNKIKSTLLRCLNCSYSAVTATGLKLAYECYFNQGNILVNFSTDVAIGLMVIKLVAIFLMTQNALVKL
jgi:hypothetical protein